jgi:hypothetical protein
VGRVACLLHTLRRAGRSGGAGDEVSPSCSGPSPHGHFQGYLEFARDFRRQRFFDLVLELDGAYVSNVFPAGGVIPDPSQPRAVSFCIAYGTGGELVCLDPQVLPDPADEAAYLAALLDYVERVKKFLDEQTPLVLETLRDAAATDPDCS